MSRLRILVVGAGGQLGRELVPAFAPHETTGLDRHQLDIVDRSAVLATVGALRPDLVVNAAAFTDVDACESRPDEAYAVNALGVRHLAEACRLVGAHLTTVSTDYVFDGTSPRPYHEWDEPAPSSVYGRSKLAGEREALPTATVVRTSWLCGRHGPNMVRTILRLLDGEGSLRFVDDQRGHPTFVSDLVPVLRRLTIERRQGVFHVTNQGAVSWYEFAREVAAAAGHDPNRVEPIATADLDPPRPAPRPANSVLDNRALRLLGWAPTRDFRQPLAELVAALRA